ncbi:sulfate ABC transporter substrate-binding protein [Devosia insulae]|uniref:sulfate ABC transporter substrate-binding protein n=1 Tax=Devosia insulae TaxID=408174 RepID=UPI000A06C1BB|nr:sulfate ABC transporter substrate-binding protein [Devosia insulae]
MKRTARILALGGLAVALAFTGAITARAQDQTLLNVSYDPTRELYAQFNEAFARHWKDTTGGNVTIEQSHGGSGKQAQSVIDGLSADVVTLALEGDINAIAEKSGLIDANWRAEFPHNSTPYTSTIVFLVREGNPKAIADWGDLVKEGVEVITPNPKTSGGARWNYLAAWAYANKAFGGDETRNTDFIKQLFSHVPVLDTGARGSTVTFAQKELGDVLLAWENEAFLVLDEFGADNFDVVHPPSSILAEPPVAIVDKNVEAHGTADLAKAYIEYLYSPEGQTLAAKNHYRPSDPSIVTDKALVEAFPKIDLISIDDPLFGGWKTAQPKHFGDGGIFDQVYTPAQ